VYSYMLAARRQGRDDVRLEVGERPVVHLNVRGGTRPAVHVVGELGGEIDLPVPVLDRLGVVGHIEGTCQYSCRSKEEQYHE